MARRRRSEQDGAAAVEFALVLPILILILFGIINFGVIFAQNLAIGNGARQAARLGVVEGTTCAQMITEARENSNSIGLDGYDPNVVVEVIAPGGGTCTGGTEPCLGSANNTSVQVRVTVASDVMVPFPPMPETINIDATGEFRCEFS